MLLLGAGNALAAERGLIIRAGELKAQPFIDAAKTASVTPNQPVTIVERKGAWASVESNGQKGWVRLLNVRLEPRSGAASTGRPGSTGGITSLLSTGSRGGSVTTGVKGMDETDIRNASPNLAELDRLNGLSVEPPEARADATKYGLKENTLGYLDEKRGRRR
jgi:hypothetical protein